MKTVLIFFIITNQIQEPLVYVTVQRTADASQLQQDGIDAVAYHAMDTEERSKIKGNSFPHPQSRRCNHRFWDGYRQT